MRAEFATELAIVLTGAITVGVDFAVVADPAERRRQYLEALKFYRAFGPVYFIENSNYDLLADSAFTELSGVRLRKFRPLPPRERGKGYQEFSALDRWHDSELEPPRRLLKITGRYLVQNVSQLLGECRRAHSDIILVDQYERDKAAHTSLFSMTWEKYRQYAYGLYLQSDDEVGIWIEHVLYNSLKDTRSSCRLFAHEPRVSGLSGSTGESFENSELKWATKQILRTINRIMQPSLLHWRGGNSKSQRRMPTHT